MSVIVNHYQQAVLDFVRGGVGHGVVTATAGSGKTTTLIQVAELLVSELLTHDQQACFLAFNRSTAAELRQRLPAGIVAITIHALGRSVLASELAREHAREQPTQQPASAPAHGKYFDLASVLIAESTGPVAELEPAAAASYLARLTDLCRLELADSTSAAALQAVADRYRLRSPSAHDTDALLALLPTLLERGLASARSGTYDFTDMIYLPVHLHLPPPRFAFVCVDEAQDLSRLNLEFVMQLIGAGARALFVGDPHQAIYAFAGADAQSLDRIVERTQATLLPLSVSFRCPVRHVTLARRFSPAMQTNSGAAVGSVSVITEAELVRRVRPGDLVMSRTNAPLIALALTLAEHRLPTRVLGDDLARETIELATRLFPTGDLSEAHAVVASAAAEDAQLIETRLLTSEDLPGELDRSADRHQALQLALTALEQRWHALVEETTRRHWFGRWRLGALQQLRPTIADLTAVLEWLLGGEVAEGEDANENGEAPTPFVTLSTIHKAKGREAARVFIYHPETLGVSSGDEEDDLSESNVLFVALTRAKRDLVFVESHQGAVAQRSTVRTSAPGLQRSWEDVLRLALIMARLPSGAATPPKNAAQRLIIRHAATRRVQEPRWEAGGSRRGGGRR